MPAFIFCASRMYQQRNYISGRYTSDLQTETEVVSVLSKYTEYAVCKAQQLQFVSFTTAS